MFSVKLFTNRTLIQAINYFNHNNLVKADDLNSDTTLTPIEKSSLFFSAFVKHKTFSNWKSQDIFPNVPDDGDESYVSMATFDSRLMNVGLFEDNKFSCTTLEIWAQNTSENTFNLILTEAIENIKIDFCKTPNNLNYFQISITKHTFNKILAFLKENENHDNAVIFLKWSEKENTGLWLLQICIDTYEILHMYWPQADISETMINDFLNRNSLIYSENHKESFMYTIDFLKTEIDGNNSKTLKIDDKLNLHIDKMPTMFLYRSTEIPELQFFDKFNIKIKPYDERNAHEKLVGDFKNQPSVLLEFSKKNTDSGSYINLQITEYENDEKSELYFVDNCETKIAYKNIDFGNAIITSQQKSATLYTTLETRKTKPVLKMGFFKKKHNLFYEPEAYKALENSISKIIILPYEGENRAITIDKDAFKIYNDDSAFIIKLHHSIFSADDIPSIKSILANGNGIFKIYVLCNNYILIESTLCFYNNEMWSLSTNTLIEYLSAPEFQNGDKKPPSSVGSLFTKEDDIPLNNSHKKGDNKAFQETPSSEKSPPTKEDDIPLTNSHKKGDNKASKKTSTSSKNKSNTSDADSLQGNVSVESESGNEKVPIVISFSPNLLINTQVLQGHNNTDSKISYDTTKNKNNSKPENIRATFENTFENEEVEFGNTTILISSALVGGAGIGGFIAYIFSS